MIKSVLIVVCVLLAVSGLCEFIHTIRVAFCIPKKGRRGVMVVWLKPGICTQQIRFVSQQIEWYGSAYADHIIAVTSEVGDEELTECRALTENTDIILCPQEVLAHIVGYISDYQE